MSVQMQSPWVVYEKAARAVLEDKDPDVTIEYDNSVPVLKLYVRGADKADSMSHVMPCEVTYGGVTMPVEVIPDNDGELTMADHLRRAFAGNPVLSDIVECPVVPGGPSMTYALFEPAVVQIEVDNAGSPYGVRTATYEELAKEVLAGEGVLIASELV